MGWRDFGHGSIVSINRGRRRVDPTHELGIMPGSGSRLFPALHQIVQVRPIKVSDSNARSRDTPAVGAWLGQLDRSMAANPWHPRIAPFFTWIVLMALTGLVQGQAPAAWPVLYAIKCGLVGWLLWRYRHWISEVNWRFHWLALPTGVGLLIVWVGLGWWMAGQFGPRLDALLAGEPLGLMRYEDPANVPALATTEPGLFSDTFYHHWLPGLFTIAIVFKLIGMAFFVPMFEELFVRSALLRGLNRWHETRRGLLQVACDLPVIGEWLIHTRPGREATQQPPIFTRQLQNTAVGVLGVCGVVLSTMLFASWHAPRDWPGAIACGVVWCWLVWWTNRGSRKLGLGPVIWSHAITNALLWAYTLWSWDWQFL
jgi:membrane protease YdiL (CAAX protease family)